jgi:hypothetical protein
MKMQENCLGESGGDSARARACFLFRDRTRFDALGAYDHFNRLSVFLNVDFLEIGQPAAVFQVVRVAHPVPDGGTLSADFTAT